jgi:hypothetical protein
VVLVLLAACGGTETGNPGTRGMKCSADSQCLETAELASEAVRQPSTPPTFTEQRCEPVPSPDGGVGPDTTCVCSNGVVGAVLATAPASPCAVFGRARDCLYEAARFTGCDPAIVTSCDMACGEVEALLGTDAARAVEVSVHSGVCVSEQCRSILSIEGRCFVNDSTLAHDCGLSASEILSREAQNIP